MNKMDFTNDILDVLEKHKQIVSREGITGLTMHFNYGRNPVVTIRREVLKK